MDPVATSETRILHFCDPRPPHELRVALERDHMVLLAAHLRDSRLVFSANSRINGAPYALELMFEAALEDTNCYVLRIGISWRDQTASAQAYHRQAAPGWLQLWLGRYRAAAPTPMAGSDSRYDAQVQSALAAEAHLLDIQAIQQAILAGLRAGGRFATSHKEGGTRIVCRGDRFVREDFGEQESRHVYASEADLLAGLRQFFDWQISRGTYPDGIDEYSAWKLVLRLLEPRDG